MLDEKKIIEIINGMDDYPYFGEEEEGLIAFAKRIEAEVMKNYESSWEEQLGNQRPDK